MVWEMPVLTLEGICSIISLPIFLTLEATENSYRPFYHLNDAVSINTTLVRFGALGVSPDTPKQAISLQTLEAFRQLHRVCPRLSINAFAKATQHLHRVRLSDNPSFCLLLTSQ